jgi:hypothetical protein
MGVAMHIRALCTCRPTMPKQKGTGKKKRSSNDELPPGKRKQPPSSDTSGTSMTLGTAMPLRPSTTTPSTGNAGGLPPMQRFNLQTGAPLYSQATSVSCLPSVVAVMPQSRPQSLVTEVNADHESKTWFEACQRNGRMDNETMLTKDISTYVRYELFPKLKFIMNSKQLNYSSEEKSICGLICTAMGLVDEKAAVSWWERYKDMIADVLNAKRADVTGAIKRAFLRKSKKTAVLPDLY